MGNKFYYVVRWEVVGVHPLAYAESVIVEITGTFSCKKMAWKRCDELNVKNQDYKVEYTVETERNATF